MGKQTRIVSDREMTQKINITSKNGTEITLTISGTQEDPKITAERFVVRGKKMYGAATILQHLGRKGSQEYRTTEAGLLFKEAQRTYIQCADAMPAIRAAVADLPHKQYWARKVDDIIDLDGDRCPVTRWEFDRALKTEKDTYISESEMGSYLDSKGVTEIEIADAVRMWADEKEEVRIKANEAGNKRAKAMFDADVAEVGYRQACENAGIPKHLR